MSSPIATMNSIDDFTVLSENKTTQEVLLPLQDSKTIADAVGQNTETGTTIMINTSVAQNIETSPSTSSDTSRSISMSSSSRKSSHSEKKQSDTKVSTKQTSPPVHKCSFSSFISLTTLPTISDGEQLG